LADPFVDLVDLKYCSIADRQLPQSLIEYLTVRSYLNWIVSKANLARHGAEKNQAAFSPCPFQANCATGETEEHSKRSRVSMAK
jgi:hypothetical protein